MTATTAEVTWIRHLLTEMRENVSSSNLMCDNKSAIQIVFNPVHHSQTKHIEIDQHFIKQKIADKEIEPVYVSSEDQVADMFTKGLTSQCFWYLKNKLYMVHSHAQLEGRVLEYELDMDPIKDPYPFTSFVLYSNVTCATNAGHFCLCKMIVTLLKTNEVLLQLLRRIVAADSKQRKENPCFLSPSPFPFPSYAGVLTWYQSNGDNPGHKGVLRERERICTFWPRLLLCKSTLCLSVTPATFCDSLSRLLLQRLSVTPAIFCKCRRVHKSRAQEPSFFNHQSSPKSRPCASLSRLLPSA